MRALLFVLSVIAFLAGLLLLANAKSALHELEALIAFVIWAVFLTGAGVIEVGNRIAGRRE